MFYINGVVIETLNMPKPIMTMVVFIQSQQPLEDLDAQLRRALSPETAAATSVVGVSLENLDEIFPNILYS